MIRLTMNKDAERQPKTVVHWMGTQIAFHSLRSDSDGVKVDKSFVVPWTDEEYSFDHPEALGAWISDELVLSGLTPDRTIISLPRQSTMVRVIDVSHIDTTEVPRAVALHVESLEHTLNRELAYDYVLHERLAGVPYLATLVTCPRAVVDGITKAIGIAGFDATACCLGELALSTMTRAAGDQTTLIVLANDVKLDVVLARNQSPVAALATRMPSSTEEAAAVVQQLTSRLLASVSEDVAEAAPENILIVGSRADSVAASFRASSSANTETIPDFGCHELLPVAVALQSSRPETMPDLMHPTIPLTPWQQAKQLWLRRGIAVAAAVLAGTAGLMTWHSSLTHEVAEATVRMENFQAVVDRADPTVRKWEFLTAWQSNSVNVAEEVLRMTGHLPSQERLYLTRLQIEDLPGDGTAILRMDGLARENDDVMALNRELLNADYDLRPHGIEPSTRDNRFQSQFQIEATLTPTLEDM
jgi:hypothetical protein